MTKAIAITYDAVSQRRAVLSAIALTGCLFLALLYAFRVYNVVSTALAAERAEREASALSGSIASLDADYLGLLSKVTPDALKAYGLEAGQVTAYIQSNAPVASLGMAASGHEY